MVEVADAEAIVCVVNLLFDLESVYMPYQMSLLFLARAWIITTFL